MGNPLILIDPTGKGPTDWIKNKDGEYVWDNTVTSESNVKDGQTYIGKNGADIVKDLLGSTEFGASTYDYGTIGSSRGKGYVATSHAKVFTSMSINVEAKVNFNENGRTFEGLNISASGQSWTWAPIEPKQKLGFNITKFKLNGKTMSESTFQHGSIGPQQTPYKVVNIKSRDGFISADKVYSSDKFSFAFEGQITFGGNMLMKGTIVGGVLPPNKTYTY